MPRSWIFVRYRPLIMQIVLWVLLGATIGLAGLLDHHLRVALYVPLAGPIVDGPVNMQFPAGWRVASRRGDDDATIHIASEPNSPSGRTIVIMRQHVSRLMSPLEYLFLSGQLAGGNEPQTPFDPWLIDGWPGQSVVWRGAHLPGGRASDQFVAAYCVVLPTRDAVTIRLQRHGTFEAPDLRLVKQVIGAVRFAGLDHSWPATCSWPDGATLSAPPGYMLYPQLDPLRTDRTLVLQNSEGDWISAQFIPVLLSAEQDAGSLRQVIAANQQSDGRNPEWAIWLKAEVTEEETGRWLIEPRERNESRLRRRAYVVAGPGSRGMAVVLTCIVNRSDLDLDSVWTTLAEHIHFGERADLRALLRGGATAAAAPAAPVAGEQWWIWNRDSTPAGWSDNNNVIDPANVRVIRDMKRRNWNGTYTRVTQDWGLSGTPERWAQMEREDAGADPGSRFSLLFRERTQQSSEIITTIDWGLPQKEVMPLPPAFLLGGHFPGILAAMPKEPLAIWTDRFPGVAAELLTSPVLLLIHRVESGAKSESGDLRCVEVEINGTGQLSRWYFTASGTLHHADLANGVTLQPSNPAQIELTFAREPGLTVHAR